MKNAKVDCVPMTIRVLEASSTMSFSTGRRLARLQYQCNERTKHELKSDLPSVTSHRNCRFVLDWGGGVTVDEFLGEVMQFIDIPFFAADEDSTIAAAADDSRRK